MEEAFARTLSHRQLALHVFGVPASLWLRPVRAAAAQHVPHRPATKQVGGQERACATTRQRRNDAETGL